MGQIFKGSLRAGVALAALGAGAGSALAGGFINQSQSTVFNGSAYAGYAAPGSSPSAMFLNPATITGFQQITTENNFSLVMPNTKITGTGRLGTAGSGDIGQDALVPASYLVIPLTDPLYFGAAFNAPYGLTTKPDKPWGGQMNSMTTKARTYNLTPSLAYKVSDTVSLGFGVQAQYFDAKFISAIGAGADPSIAGFKGDGWGFGVTAGLTWKPLAGTAIGLGYRSRIDQAIEGQYMTSGLLAGLNGSAIKGTLKLRDRVNLSLRQTVTQEFDLLASVEWQGWSRIGTAPLSGPLVAAAPGTLQSIPFNYKDGWFFALGGEYKWSQALTVRGGVAYELSPVTTEVRTTRLPDNNRLWLSTGLSYEVNDRFTVNASYSHIFVKEAPIAIGPGHATYSGTLLNAYNGSAKSQIDIFSLGVTTKWGAKAPGVLVAKY
jgi:long-chain fatty acid transport protein